ncbi:MAG: thiamine phosphate synthase [Deltaproteobacteria bacterium]|nr:thiamine phosphate synthase [Deltaproteobacteria bacterium]
MISVAGIYPIVDVGPRLPAGQAPALLTAFLAGGARLIQLRAKTLGARALLGLARPMVVACHAAGARLIVNDRPDVALLAGADGVHLGQDDLPATEVRRWLPSEMMIGVSCHDRGQLERALAEGVATYYAHGPVYATRSKERPDPVVGLDGLAEACRIAGARPVVAIGGIHVEQLAAVRQAGAAAAAMISDLIEAQDPEARVRAAIAAFGG